MSETEYICDYCSRSFTRKYNLSTHIENCHLNESCYCNICGQQFGSPAGLQLHLSRGHNRYSQALPECDICGRIFTRKQNITSHMITVHLQVLNPIKCSLCSKFFTTERNMKRHIRQIHNLKGYLSCDQCHKLFKRKRSLTLHIQAIHNSLTATKIHTDSSLNNHVENQVKTDSKCDFCSKIYFSNHDWKRHILSMHIRDKLKYFTCKLCSESILEKDFQKHTNMYCIKKNRLPHQYSEDLTKLNLICDTCDASFKEENSLRQHIKKDHNFQDFYKYCKKTLILKSMENIYDKTMVYNCEFCPYLFWTIDELKYHMNMHHNVEYSLTTCKVCYAKFFSKESLLLHKKYCFPPVNVKTCNYCDKLFSNSSSLQFHEKIFHPQKINNTSISGSEYLKKTWKNKIGKLRKSSRGLKSNLCKNSDLTHYKCNECSAYFKEKRSLRRHIRTKHSNSEIFPQCQMCKLQFETEQSCNRHLKAIHNIVMTPNISSTIGNYNNSKGYYNICDVCKMVFNEKTLFEEHKKAHIISTNRIPKCIICVKYFSSRKTLKRHIKKFHCEFQVNELADFGTLNQEINVKCEDCIEKIKDNYHFGVYQKWKHISKTIIFKCETCKSSYNCLEYAIQRYKQNFDITKSNLYLSELCTTEMSDSESQIGQVEQVSSTVDIKSEPKSIKTEPNSDEESDYETMTYTKEDSNLIYGIDIKDEPFSP